MIGVVYLGNNPKTQERLRYIPGQLVRMTNAYKDAAQICTPHVSNEHFIVFFERNVRNEDITAITYLRKKCHNVYIILITNNMSEEERDIYMKCGIARLHYHGHCHPLGEPGACAFQVQACGHQLHHLRFPKVP